jgi:hypothetical protein
MPDHHDEPKPLPADDVAFPVAVRAAGIVWIIFGCLILLNAAVNFLLTAGAAAAGAPQVAGGTCGLLLAVLFGAVFIHVGIQSVRGTAKDTLGNGIGSIVIGALNMGIGGVLMAAGLAAPGTASLIAVVGGGISILGGCGLIGAGILALAGRSAYRSWRHAHGNGVVNR